MATNNSTSSDINDTGKSSTFSAVAVFCGSRLGTVPEFKDAAEALGKELLSRNISYL